jgi:hypothetical protein
MFGDELKGICSLTRGRVKRRTFIIAALPAGSYRFLYVALQLQDDALLLGTAGRFAV